MDNNSEKQRITIRFGSWDLPMTVFRKDEHLYREAEKLMKERYAFYTNNYKGLQTERYMMMCMLDIAVRYLQQQNDLDTLPFMQSIEQLTGEIEEVLGEDNKKH